MAQLGELAGVTSRGPAGGITAAAAMRQATLQPMNLVATLQGANVLAEHLYVISAIWGPVTMLLTEYFGMLMAEVAKANHFKNIDTQATYDSIKSSAAYPLTSGAAVDISVATPQAQFLEFGFVHHITGNFIHNPFMMPAADAVAPLYVDALSQLANIAMGQRAIYGPGAASGANSVLGSVRGMLYSFSKFAGDIQVLGFAGLSKYRGVAIKGASALGTVSAIGSGTASARAVRLVAGRFGGSAIRGGNFGGSALTGASGRIYNRLSGRAFGGTLSGISL